MEVRLVMVTDDGSERVFRVPPGVAVIGRASFTDIRISLPSVEPRHCELMHDGDQLRIRDLGSDLGTHLNGRTVAEAELRNGDCLSIGRVAFLVCLEDKVAPAGELITELKPSRRGPVTTALPDSGVGRAGESPGGVTGPELSADPAEAGPG
ncbi:MAG: FHA domain-containing protein [Phycisphaerales bacterium]|nr:MAG: FHA domain-containing protein [Phycisphaerales bacterium]